MLTQLFVYKNDMIITFSKRFLSIISNLQVR